MVTLVTVPNQWFQSVSGPNGIALKFNCGVYLQSNDDVDGDDGGDDNDNDHDDGDDDGDGDDGINRWS